MPFIATIVFLKCAGNPKGIKHWDDVVTPNPKASDVAGGSIMPIAETGVRDVLMTWKNDTASEDPDFGTGKFEFVSGSEGLLLDVCPLCLQARRGRSLKAWAYRQGCGAFVPRPPCMHHNSADHARSSILSGPRALAVDDRARVERLTCQAVPGRHYKSS